MVPEVPTTGELTVKETRKSFPGDMTNVLRSNKLRIKREKKA